MNIEADLNGNNVFLNKIRNKNIFVTGATGLIGSTFIKMIDEWNCELDLQVGVFALVRDIEKAQKLFHNCQKITYLQGDIRDKTLDLKERMDYIVHAASVTDSRTFVGNPVETIETSVLGTKLILDYAKEKEVESVVYLSSMEVYGEIQDSKPLTELEVGYLNPLSVRSSYSEAKRLAETLCVSYFSEYSVPVKIVRLAQTFGPGIRYDEKRIFAEIARCVIENRDIVLYTSGESEHMYLYTRDAVKAILTVLVNGENGNAYNVANKNTYCSIKEMAELVSNEIAKNAIKVIIDKKQNTIYAPEHHIYLDTSKMEKLGWKAKTNLLDMYSELIESMKEKTNE